MTERATSSDWPQAPASCPRRKSAAQLRNRAPSRGRTHSHSATPRDEAAHMKLQPLARPAPLVATLSASTVLRLRSAPPAHRTAAAACRHRIRAGRILCSSGARRWAMRPASNQRLLSAQGCINGVPRCGGGHGTAPAARTASPQACHCKCATRMGLRPAAKAQLPCHRMHRNESRCLKCRGLSPGCVGVGVRAQPPVVPQAPLLQGRQLHC